jgi:alpha-D-xyloside xylohydrolase
MHIFLATTNQAYTPMRPLAMDFCTHTRAARVSDQFMFGSAFLVNPVTEPGADPPDLSATSPLV